MKMTWEHHSLVQNLRADEMIAGQSERDPELKRLRAERERLLDEIGAFLRMTISPSNPGESPEMTTTNELSVTPNLVVSRESFEKAVDEYANIAFKNGSASVTGGRCIDVTAARSRLLQLWDEREKEVEEAEMEHSCAGVGCGWYKTTVKLRAEVERLRDSVLTAAQAADLLSVLGRHPEEYPWVAPGTYQKLHANWLRAQRDTAESRVPPKGENTDGN